MQNTCDLISLCHIAMVNLAQQLVQRHFWSLEIMVSLELVLDRAAKDKIQEKFEFAL